jgi:hypothetical protein
MSFIWFIIHQIPFMEFGFLSFLCDHYNINLPLPTIIGLIKLNLRQNSV